MRRTARVEVGRWRRRCLVRDERVAQRVTRRVVRFHTRWPGGHTQRPGDFTPGGRAGTPGGRAGERAE